MTSSLCFLSALLFLVLFSANGVDLFSSSKHLKFRAGNLLKFNACSAQQNDASLRDMRGITHLIPVVHSDTECAAPINKTAGSTKPIGDTWPQERYHAYSKPIRSCLRGISAYAGMPPR